MDTEITCTKCGVTQPTTNYYKSNTTKTGYNYQCKSCIMAYNKAYLAKMKNTYTNDIEQYKVPDDLDLYHAESRKKIAERAAAILERQQPV